MLYCRAVTKKSDLANINFLENYRLKRVCLIFSIQLYPAVPPPDIPPNSLTAMSFLCMEFFSYIKPLIHPLYRHSPCIVQTRLHHREKWIEYCHQRSINQWQSRSRHNMLVVAETRLSTEQRWQSWNSYLFIFKIHTYYSEKWWWW